MAVMDMKQKGWVWEGIGCDPELLPTIYGVGEGVGYFGVTGANYMFHPNNDVAMQKLSHVPQITADISKWVWFETKSETGRFAIGQSRDDNPEAVMAEAANVSRLSLEYPNLVAAFIDDTHGVATHANATPDAPARIKEALCQHNPDLDLWIVVYTHELDKPYWKDWMGAVDVINLWVWEYQNLVHLEEYLSRCHEIFPDKRVVMGIYIHDYPSRSPLPLDYLQIELDTIVRHLESGSLDGYNILGNCIIDQHPAQAEFIRDFIQSH